MEIHYEYIHDWGGNLHHKWNGVAMQIQQIQVQQSEIVFLSLCESVNYNEYGEVITSYVTEELAKWFYEKAIPLCYRWQNRKYLTNRILQSCKQFLYGMNKDISWYQNFHKSNQKISFSILFIIENKYFMIQTGDITVFYLSNKKVVDMKSIVTKKMLKQLSDRKNYDKSFSPIVKTGRLSRTSGIMMSSQSYFQYTSIDTFHEHYIRMLKSHTKMQKLLSEIGTRNRNKNGHKQMEAIMIWRK